MKSLRKASLGSNFTGSYKKKECNPPNTTSEGQSQFHYWLILRLIKASKRRLAFWKSVNKD